MVLLTPSWLGFAYVAIALVVSVYQAYRGFMLQWVLGVKEIQGSRRVLLLCLADMFTYLICAASGFVALYLLFEFFEMRQPRLPDSGGEATWLIFLALYGLVGVTGKLPEILTKIKIPGAGD
jgi:hypothetical protein